MKTFNSIMLVDDDSTTNFMNELLIQEMGITREVVIAKNGQEALDKVEAHCGGEGKCPELILLDINMPVLNGFDFLEAYEKRNFKGREATVIIMLTTSLNPQDLEKVKPYKVAGFLNKPLKENDLQEVFIKCFG
jgi:CheY-like chemotaxis protein